MNGHMRRATDALDLTDQQKAFLDQVCANVGRSVSEAVSKHEETVHHEWPEDVQRVILDMLAEGNFVLPEGITPRQLVQDHESLMVGQHGLTRNVNKILDVVIGPIKQNFLGDEDPDGERDEEAGLMAQMDGAMQTVAKLDKALSNGGVPVKLPSNVKAAIWTAAGTITAAGLSGTALIVTQLIK